MTASWRRGRRTQCRPEMGLVGSTPSHPIGGTDRGDEGDTLIEILFSLLILSVATVALLIAFATSISASATHRTAATFDTAIRSASQQAVAQLQQQTSPLYKSCGTLAYYTTPQAQGGGAPTFSLTGYTAAITGVQYWSGSSFSSNGTCVPELAGVDHHHDHRHDDPPDLHHDFIIQDPFAPPVPPTGPAYQLVFAVQPAGALVSQPFATQPVIRVEDQNGHLVTTDLSPVTLSIIPGTGTNGASLSQYCVGTEVSGVISFNNCSIDTAGLTYQPRRPRPA